MLPRPERPSNAFTRSPRMAKQMAAYLHLMDVSAARLSGRQVALLCPRVLPKRTMHSFIQQSLNLLAAWTFSHILKRLDDLLQH